ncbi:MAG: VWA domain-containing protein, partial [Patescibacteria group bacterium]|nr:VWA domain-containing protein [Patescibacteria group bacterium]
MTQITKYTSVRGSLQSQANKLQIGVAQAFLDCEKIVCLDVSPSMNEKDCPGLESRYRVATNQLAKLQSENPGKVGLVCWSS